jgi:hypothetical protein
MQVLGNTGLWIEPGQLRTWRVSSLENPVCVFSVSNDSIIPLDDKMTRCSFEQGWPREIVHIQLRFRRHIDTSSEME